MKLFKFLFLESDYQNSMNRSNYLVQEIEGLRIKFQQAHRGFGTIESLIKEVPGIETLVPNNQELLSIKTDAFQGAQRILVAENTLTVKGIYSFIAEVLNKKTVEQLKNYETVSRLLKIPELEQGFNKSVKVIEQLVSNAIPTKLPTVDLSYSLYRKLWDLGFTTSDVILTKQENRRTWKGKYSFYCGKSIRKSYIYMYGESREFRSGSIY
jgi:hypothetical protein